MIIAEMCQNHNGDEGLLLEMVEAAAKAGARFAKIQSFFAEDLGEDFKHERERMASLELTWEEQRRFSLRCVASGLVPMTSVYKLSYADRVWDAGFQFVKIGSAQAQDKALIQGYVRLGFKVIVSTGGHATREIPKIIPLAGVLHCVSKYPSTPHEAGLSRMLELRDYFGGSVSVGLSDHTDPKSPHWDLPAKLALALGATYVEKHFTLLPRNGTKDGPVSISPEQLQELCRFDRLDQDDKLREHPEFRLFVHTKDPAERELIRRYKKRWATQATS